MLDFKIPIERELYRMQKIKYKGKDIQTYMFGKGDINNAVFSFPAFPHSGLMYLYFLWHYDPQSLCFVTFDLPGWIGKSEVPFENNRYDEEEVLEIATKVRDNYGINKYNVVGYSFGSTLAARLGAMDSENIKKIAFVSPVLAGKDIKEGWRRATMEMIGKLGLWFFVKKYLYYKFSGYKKVIKASFEEEGMDTTVIDAYETLIAQSDSRVIYESLYKLFNSDYSDYVRQIPPEKVIVVSSKGEDPYLRKQAEHVRRILDGEQTAFLEGDHQAFILDPKSDSVNKVLKMLLD